MGITSIFGINSRNGLTSTEEVSESKKHWTNICQSTFGNIDHWIITQ